MIRADDMALDASRAVSAAADSPFFDARRCEAHYHGPGREDPIPDRLGAINLGWFGQCEHTEGTDVGMFHAAEMAIEDANHAGGYDGVPFRLIPAWSADPWGTGVRAVTRLVYDDQVWALLGGPDGATTHLAEQVVAKARLPLISPVATDTSANLANVPWVFFVGAERFQDRRSPGRCDSAVRRPETTVGGFHAGS